MTTLALKSYQQAALDSLATFARAAQTKGPTLAFGELVGRPYNPDPFGEVPCVCLRIPTGGGKTLMSDPSEIEKRQVGELWARKSQGRCVFGQITKERDGVGTAGQLDALLA